MNEGELEMGKLSDPYEIHREDNPTPDAEPGLQEVPQETEHKNPLDNPLNWTPIPEEEKDKPTLH